MLAPLGILPDSLHETLADVRAFVSRYPEIVTSVEPRELARRLNRPQIEVEVALEWLLDDALEVRG